MVFFVPFIIADGSMFSNMFFPYITGKNFTFRILIEVLFGVYVLLALREPKYRPRTSLLMWAFAIFVAWIGVATPTSVDPIKSFWSNFERMEGYITTLHLFAYFIMLGAVVSAEEWWDRLFQFSIASSAVMGGYAMLQLADVLLISTQSGSRVDATFGNATYLAIFMLFNIFITLFMLARHRHSVMSQAVYGIALVLQVASLFYTQTRGALLGVIGGLIITGLYVVLRGRIDELRTARKISLYGLGIIAVVIVGFLSVRDTAFVKNSQTLSRFASISFTDTTTESRFQIWGMALNGAKEKPLLGWGQENFSYVFNKYYTPQMYKQEQWFDRAHNQFLDWLIVGGIPAFILYISLFVLAGLAIMRAKGLDVLEQGILLGLLAGYAFNNLLVFDDIMSSVYFFMILAFAHGLSKRALPWSVLLSKPVSDKTIAVVAPFVLTAVLVGVWALNAPGIARAENLLNALMTQVGVSDGQGGMKSAPKDPKQQLQEFKIAFSNDVWPGTPLGKQEVTEQLFQFASGAIASTSVDPATKQDLFALTSSAGKDLLAERKRDARIELFYAAFFGVAGQIPLAIENITLARADSPRKQQIMFQEGILHLNNGDIKSALEVFKLAFDEAPDYSDARILYAIAITYSGDKQSADALLIQGFGTVLVDDQRILEIYTKNKQNDRVIGIWKSRVASRPNDHQTHIGLASAYFTAGDKGNAIAELQRVAELNPVFAGEVTSLIKQIQDGTLKIGQ